MPIRRYPTMAFLNSCEFFIVIFRFQVNCPASNYAALFYNSRPFLVNTGICSIGVLTTTELPPLTTSPVQ